MSTFAVDHMVDENDGNTTAGHLSLREAILLANANPGADEIDMPAGTYRLAIAGANEQTAKTGDLDIYDSVTIHGGVTGATTIDGAGLDRIFDIFKNAGGDGTRPVVVLAGLNLVGGQTPQGTAANGGAINVVVATVTVQDCTIRGNATGAAGFGGAGGGIYADQGDLTVLRSTIDSNRTGDGTSNGGNGGGIAGNASVITVRQSTISNNITGIGATGNITAGRGGGVFSESGVPSAPGVLTVEDSTIANNRTGGNTAGSKGLGGGIYNYVGSSFVLRRSTVQGNTAYDGGGVMTDNGIDGQILDSTIADNTADGDEGGGVAIWLSRVSLISGTTISGNRVLNANTVYSGGGGIYNNSREVDPGDGRRLIEVVNSTIANNTVTGTGSGFSHYAVGGGILNTGDIDHLVNTTIAGNSAREAGGLFHATFGGVTPVIGELANTLIADNVATGSFPKDFEPLGQVTTAENNLVEDPASHGLTDGVNGNVVGHDPALGALTDNGGPTATMALLAGSPAIDAGRNAGAPATDQRGVSRPQGLTVDIGAFELPVVANRAPTANNDAYTVAEDGVLVVPAPAGPVLRYGFDEASAGTADALDSGTYPPANATLLSGANRTASTPGGASRGALDLTAQDGTSNYVTPGDVEKVDSLSAITLTLWVNLRSTPNVNDVLLSDMPRSSDAVGSTGWELEFDSWSGGIAPVFTVYQRTGSGTTHGSGRVINVDADQKWAFMAFTYAGGVLNTYVGGEMMSLMSTGAVNVGVALTGNTAPLTIGRPSLQTTDTDSTPPAWLDDLRIYDHALSATELEAVRQSTLAPGGGGVLANDTDPDGDTLSATLVSGPANGSVIVFPDGSFHYLPNANFNGTDSFTYKASDGSLDSAPATVTITVTPTNDAPVGVGDAYTTTEDTPLTIPASTGVLANDTDIDGDTLKVARIVVPPQLGTLSLNPDGSFTYTPLPNVYTFNDVTIDRFIYTAGDGSLESQRTVVQITINPVNDPPDAVDDVATLAEDAGAVAIPVLANDSLLFDNYGAPAEALAIVGVAQPAHGTVAFTATGLTYAPAPDFNGDDSFAYTVSDSNGGGTDTATVRVTVNPVNDAPVAASQSLATDEDTPLTGAVSATDIDGDALTYVLGTGPAHGALALNSNGTFTYTPAGNYNGPDSFTFTASDGKATSAAATVMIAIKPVNDAPVAAPQALTTDEDTALNGVASATDVDGDSLTYAVGTGPAHGSLTLNSNGTFTYTPAANSNGGDSFTFTASDGKATSAAATVTITVKAINDPPVAAPQALTTDEDTARNGAVSASDVDGDSLTYALGTGPAHGALALNSNGTFTYTPAANYHGGDSFTFTANDGNATSAAATVTITVKAVNDAPVAAGQALTTDEDAPVTGAVSATDVDGDALTYAVATNPAHGALALNPNGTFTYTPAANSNGADSFTFTASDGKATSAPATVTLSINPVNDAPVAVAQNLATAEGTPLNGAVSATDIDGDSLTYGLGTGPAHGSLTLNSNGTFTYTPAANYNGGDSFTFTANDGKATSAAATVTIAVNPVNDPPVAVPQTLATDEDAALTGAVSATDTDGDPLTYAVGTGPAHGSLTLNANGTFTYTPAANYHGGDSFTFTASDGKATSAPATVTIAINPVNDTPVAAPQALATDEDAPLNGAVTASDADGDALTYAVAAAPAHGSLAFNSNGTFTYTPAANYNGPDSFGFTASDGKATSAAATVTIAIRPVNDAPVAVADAYGATEDTALTVAAPGVLGNDRDVDGDPLTAALVSGPGHGTLALNANGTFTYTPAANYNGSDSFTYRAADGQATSAPVTVAITIAAVNDAPVAGSGSVATDEDTPLTAAVSATDVDGDSLTYGLGTGPAHGSLAFNANGTFTYTPAANYNGPDGFTFTASDGKATSAAATVTIAVKPVNDPPTLADAAFSTPETSANGTTVGQVRGSDIDGDTLTYRIVDGNDTGAFAIDPATGRITVADGSQLDFETTPQFVLTVQTTDPSGASARATVTVTLTDVDESSVVRIDILPGDTGNTVNIKSKGKLEVAILSSASFDARDVDVDSLRFGRTGAEGSLSRGPKGEPRYRLADVNGDGRLDLVVQFEIEDTGFQAGDTGGILTGRTRNGVFFQADDRVTIKSPGR